MQLELLVVCNGIGILKSSDAGLQSLHICFACQIFGKLGC